MEARNTWQQLDRTPVWSILLLYRALQQKLYRQDFRNFDHLWRIVLHWWVRQVRRNRRGDMFNCCSPIDVYSRLLLSILRELCAIIERHA